MYSRKTTQKVAMHVNGKKYFILVNERMVFLSSLPNVICARMTGSGSCIVAYYKSKKSAIKGLKLFKKKYKNYWCIISKTV